MKILIACEFSGVVRNAFKNKGHNAVSCDLIPSEQPGFHLQKNVLSHLSDGWDMMLAFPPCTYLCRSGARWWSQRKSEQIAAIDFIKTLSRVSINKWMIENPIGILSTVWRKPDQIIQPWMFGHGETKATCLWLKNLPKLKPTNIVSGRKPKIHYCAPGPERAKNRSRWLPGIAKAMAEQWG
jgi:hypothetical protein